MITERIIVTNQRREQSERWQAWECGLRHGYGEPRDSEAEAAGGTRIE